jgi:hypothetical protein
MTVRQGDNSCWKPDGTPHYIGCRQPRIALVASEYHYLTDRILREELDFLIREFAEEGYRLITRDRTAIAFSKISGIQSNTGDTESSLAIGAKEGIHCFVLPLNLTS